MNFALARDEQAESGFTMIEALVAIALMGLIMGSLMAVTGQWLPSWTRGLVQVQRNEQVAIALDRLAADLSAAEYVSSNRFRNVPLFEGSELAVTFVRSALGPNSPSGLEIVQIAETADDRGPALVRSRRPFVILPTGDMSIDRMSLSDPVVLLRAPFRIAFAYAGADGKWVKTWRNSGELPAAVRFDVLDSEHGRVIVSATRIHAETAAPRPEQVIDERPDASQAQANGALEIK